MPLLVRDGAGGSEEIAGDVGERTAGRGVEEPVVPRVADAPAESREPPLADLIAEGGVGGKLERACLLAHGRDVSLEADYAVCALQVEARGDADDAAAEVKSGRLIRPGHAISQRCAAPSAAAGDADVRAGPGRRGRCFVDRCNTEVSGDGWRRQCRRRNQCQCRRACAQRSPHPKPQLNAFRIGRKT
jgi:hypothetical protein